MRTGTPSLFLLLLFASMPVGARAQWRTPEAPPTDVVVITSGGVSQGSYLAGVNWAIASFLRLNPLDYRLSAVAGASAGNINSLLNVIEYCQGESAPPEESEFWRVWVRTGIDELLPDGGRRQPPARTEGLFTRKSFEEVHFPSVTKALSTGIRPGCTEEGIPVGIVVTKIEPTRYAVPQSFLSATTQRLATTFLMQDSTYRVSGSTDAVLHFVPPYEGLIDPAAGSFIFLPRNESGLIARDSVYALLQASSAFPFAFAPLAMDHVVAEEGGTAVPKCYSGTHTRCPTAPTEFFADGGIFDNNPVDLGYRLHQRHATKKRARKGGGPPLIVWADPDEIRGPLEREASDVSDPAEFRGLSALKRLLAGAVPTARQYELFAFARHQSERGGPERPFMAIASRSHPIAGHYMQAFAAFLSRTLRELDFYVGVYDGLHFVAARLLCPPEGVPVGAVGQETCTVETLQDLITGGPGRPSLSLAAAAVAEELFWTEHTPALERPPFPPLHAAMGVDSARAMVYGRAARFLERSLGHPEAAACRDVDWVEGIVCTDGFVAYLSNLDSIVPRVDTLCEELSGCGGSKQAAEFERLVKRPTHRTADVIERALFQAWRIENDKGEDGRTNSEPLVEAAAWFLAAPLARYEEGMDWNPSSVPDFEPITVPWNGGTWLKLLPYYFVLNPANAGGELGYRPRYHLTPDWALDLTGIAFNWQEPADTVSGDQRALRSGGVGLGIALKRPTLLLSGIHAGVTALAPWSGDAFSIDNWAPHLELGFDLANSKVRALARYALGGRERFFPEPGGLGHWNIYIGLQDVNGLLYWFFPD